MLRAHPKLDRPPRPRDEAEQPAYWAFVTAITDVYDLADHSLPIAALQPGNWYLVRRTEAGWAHVLLDDETEGWVAREALHRR